MSDLNFLSVRQLASMIKTCEVSAAEVTDAYLWQIQHHNGSLNAIVTLDEEGARARATEADETLERGAMLGPLHGVPVTIKELLDLMAALEARLAFADVDSFYFLSRAVLVKDEKYFDRFDQAFGAYFKDLESIDDIIEVLIPEDWLRNEFLKQLSEEENARMRLL